jgi:hypothetical protein
MKIEAALFVELLRGVEVQLVVGNAAAEAFAGDVAERAVFPGVGNRKKYCAVAANEDVLFGFFFFGRHGVAARMTRARRIVISWPHRNWNRSVVGGNGLLRVGGSFFYIVRADGHVVSPAAEKWNEATDESAIAIVVMNSLRVRRGKMRVVEAKSGDCILREQRAIRANGAVHSYRGCARWRAKDERAGASTNQSRSRNDVCASGTLRNCASSDGGGCVHDGVGSGLRSCSGTSHGRRCPSALGLKHRGQKRNGYDYQQAAHGEYLGSRAAGPFWGVHV